jgi:NADH-quinone oxidoreductase subunit N
MPVNFIPDSGEILRFLPEIILIAAGTLIMLLEALAGERDRTFLANLSLVALLAALWAALAAGRNPGLAFQSMLLVDGFATFFRVLVIVVGMLTILCSVSYLRRERANSGEYYALLLYSITGQCVMAAANELIMIFIGLEISSIASYVLAGYLRDDRRNNESALKYFLLGSFASAFLLYGIAWIYGTTGSTNLIEIREFLGAREVPVAAVGASAALMLVGFLFKVSAAPFQVWTPDVYQGAPAPVSAFLSVGPKAAAFAMLLRVFFTAFGSIGDKWEPVLWVSALATMVIGNFAALWQDNIKRLLAYSSIAHAGYVLVAVVVHSNIGAAAAMFYLASYALVNIGAFGVVSHIASKGERFVRIEDFAGLGVRRPVVAGLLTIFLLSLIGVPLTGGFFGKFYIFKAALDANLIWLTILGLLNSAVAAYYYLRVLVVMYMQDPVEGAEPVPPLPWRLKTALWASALGTLLLGIFPSLVLDYADKSANLVK